MYEEYRIAVKKRIIFFEVLGLAFCAGVYILTELFAVKNVRVEGNVHYTAADIRNITERGWFADNTLVLSAGFGGAKVKDLPFIEAISVKADSRDSITISVRGTFPCSLTKSTAAFISSLLTFASFSIARTFLSPVKKPRRPKMRVSAVARTEQVLIITRSATWGLSAFVHLREERIFSTEADSAMFISQP